MNEGYSSGEVLAAVLHSVRENYLNKVAVEAAIGDTVAFQGATARNRALVAAFEQRLGKPILVSPYCHLTGALGVALTLRDEGVRGLGFPGAGLHRREDPYPLRDLRPLHEPLQAQRGGGRGGDVAYRVPLREGLRDRRSSSKTTRRGSTSSRSAGGRFGRG